MALRFSPLAPSHSARWGGWDGHSFSVGEADFKLLKETLGLSDGNLSTHLALLDERGYVQVRKEFRGRKPHTTVTPTPSGRDAFKAYIAILERVIGKT